MIIKPLALICLLKTINKQIFLFGMKGTMNPCVTWTLHAGWYCVLSQWRPRPIWWKVYSPDEAVPSWLTPPPPTPVAMGLRASGYLCPPISPRCGSGTDPRHFLPVSACPYCVPCPFWLCVVLFGFVCCFPLPRETLQDNISHWKYHICRAFNRCLSFA